MTLAPSTRLGRYEIRSKIGQGGMGEVYLALDTQLDRPVALKILPAEVAASLERMRRFVQEAKAAAALNHPNIAHIYEIGEAAGTHFIAMEFVDGETLRQRLSTTTTPLHEALDVAIQTVSALAAAHAAGIMHRDIKPENVMLRRDRIVKVLDFGLAKLLEANPNSVNTQAPTQALIQTEPGRVLGTVQYMSPEQVRGLKVDARTDIWSLGCVLYEMIAGRAPFTGETHSHVGYAILENDPAPLTRSAPQTPAELQRIVRKALAKDRDERYQTARDLLIDLKSLRHDLEIQTEIERSLAPEAETHKPGGAQASRAATDAASPRDTGVEAARPTTSAEYLAGEIRRHKWGAAVGAASLVVLVAAGLYLLRPNRRESQAGQPRIQRKLSRLTFDTGLQSEPTWSPDGRFIAYSSDRSGNFDIWVQPLGGGNSIQVTKSPAHDWQPDWSPDGNNIVFRSEREGGGVFVVPAFGGTERKIASFGYRPRWSPDGSKVLFFSTNARNAVVPPKVYVVGLDGSPPREVLADVLAGFTGRWQISWYPDGRRVSIWGDHKKDGPSFWTVALDGGTPAKSEVDAQVDKERREAGLDLFDFRWSPDGRALYFEGVAQGVRNLWKVEVDPQSLRWTDGPERLTVGAGMDTDIALSSDGKRLAFVTRTERTRIWSLPFNAMTGQMKGQSQAVTPPELNAVACDITRDGKKLVFVAERAGKRELWVKSFEDGSEKLLLVSDKFLFWPVWSRDGTRVAYARLRPLNPEREGFAQNSEHTIAMISASGGDEQLLTTPDELQGWPWDWTADQQWILGSSERQFKDHYGLYLFPVGAAPQAENQMRLVTERPGYSAFAGRFSPDGRWICFEGASTTDEGDRQVYFIPAEGGEWRHVTEGRAQSGGMGWSPDGRIIYFESNRSGFDNLWGRRFDPQTGQLVGEPFRVTNFESPGLMEAAGIGKKGAFSVDRVVLPLTEASGSVWILDNVDR
jgi:serine/threonine protein kinase